MTSIALTGPFVNIEVVIIESEVQIWPDHRLSKVNTKMTSVEWISRSAGNTLPSLVSEQGARCRLYLDTTFCLTGLSSLLQVDDLAHNVQPTKGTIQHD
jgi:hypothetical protein